MGTPLKLCCASEDHSLTSHFPYLVDGIKYCCIRLSFLMAVQIFFTVEMTKANVVYRVYRTLKKMFAQYLNIAIKRTGY